jgi:hypothetical protein
MARVRHERALLGAPDRKEPYPPKRLSEDRSCGWPGTALAAPMTSREFREALSAAAGRLPISPGTESHESNAFGLPLFP